MMSPFPLVAENQFLCLTRDNADASRLSIPTATNTFISPGHVYSARALVFPVFGLRCECFVVLTNGGIRFGKWGIGTRSRTLLAFDREELTPSEVERNAPLQA